jgi:trigger factor
MEITSRSADMQNMILSIKLDRSDYQENYETALKSYRKQAQLPGFRAGHVPMSILQKRFGRGIMAEEMNKIINSSLQKYIQDNGINLLGGPLPVSSETESGDWDNPSEFTFEFQLGLSPVVETALVYGIPVTAYTITADNEMVEKEFADMRRRYGKLRNAERSSSNDILTGILRELDGDSDKDGGLTKENLNISIEYLNDTNLKESLTGLVIGDKVELNPNLLSANHEELAQMLSITHEDVHHLGDRFRFEVTAIQSIDLAEVNQEFFDKIYGEGQVNSEEEVMSRIRTEMEAMFRRESDAFFSHMATEEIINGVRLDLPDTFLQRWIAETSEKEISSEEIAADYPRFANGMRWQLVENAIIKDNNIKVQYEDLLQYATEAIRAQFMRYGINPGEDSLKSLAQSSLQKREDVDRMYQQLIEKRVMSLLREKMQVSEVVVSWAEFNEIVFEHSKVHAHQH